jgi:hypothetical protein
MAVSRRSPLVLTSQKQVHDSRAPIRNSGSGAQFKMSPLLHSDIAHAVCMFVEAPCLGKLAAASRGLVSSDSWQCCAEQLWPGLAKSGPAGARIHQRTAPVALFRALHAFTSALHQLPSSVHCTSCPLPCIAQCSQITVGKQMQALFLAASGHSKTSIVVLTKLSEGTVAKLMRRALIAISHNVLRRQEMIIFGNTETSAQTLASQITA